MSDRSFRPDINPALITWARSSARRSLANLAKACRTTEDVVSGWEEGTQAPTIAQLTKIAVACRCPLPVFFLSELPPERKVPKALRSLGSKGPDSYTSPTAFAVRAAMRAQDIIRELNESMGRRILPQLSRMRLDGRPESYAFELREQLGLSLAEQIKCSNESAALREWRLRVEALGVLTMQIPFPLEEGRGFSIFDNEAPVILLNSKDAPTARCFTLMHEIAHLGLRRSGIFQPDRLYDGLTSADRAEEYFCNHVAAEVLVPAYQDEVEKRLAACVTHGVVDEDAVIRLAKLLKVSRYVILRKLWSEDYISLATVRSIEDAWQAAYDTSTPPPRKPDIKISPVTKCISQKGRRFVSTVVEGLDRELITYSQAIEYLGLRMKNFAKLRERIGGYGA